MNITQNKMDAITRARLDNDGLYELAFWSTDNYNSYEEALAMGAVYSGMTNLRGYAEYISGIDTAEAVARCISSNAPYDTMVHLSVNGELIGDFVLNSCT